MEYSDPQVRAAAEALAGRFEQLTDKRSILRAVEFKALYQQIKTMPAEKRAAFGRQVNQLRTELLDKINQASMQSRPLPPIDLTAPFDDNVPPAKRFALLPAEQGSIHPLMSELHQLLDILSRMGFTAIESRQIDDDWHMFGSLNFPDDHPARDDYDTFLTDEGLVAPAHTSTMQNRVLQANRNNLAAGRPIAAAIPGRVFRNEDVDARHEHTFYQLEGVYVDQGIHAGHLITTLQTFLEAYYQTDLEVKTQPFYFPFTEPSFEFAMSCPFCQKAGCHICSQTGWIELLGCGLIHPQVLKMADIDPQRYSGFAWGGGVDRLVMMKYGVEDVRHFHSGNLKFLRQFA